MPLYEYEPLDHDCLICDGRVEVIQGVGDPVFKFCPWCGLEVRKIISRASFQMDKAPSAEEAAKKGFTTFRRAEKGVWEKVAGEGPDYMVGSKEDIAAVDAEKAPKTPVLDFDQES